MPQNFGLPVAEVNQLPSCVRFDREGLMERKQNVDLFIFFQILDCHAAFPDFFAVLQGSQVRNY